MKDRRLHIVTPIDQLSDTDVREILTDQILLGLENKYIIVDGDTVTYKLDRVKYSKLDKTKVGKLTKGGAYFEGAVSFASVVDAAFLDTVRRTETQTDWETQKEVEVDILWRDTIIFTPSADEKTALIYFTDKDKVGKGGNGKGSDKKSNEFFFKVFETSWLSPMEVDDWKVAENAKRETV